MDPDSSFEPPAELDDDLDLGAEGLPTDSDPEIGLLPPPPPDESGEEVPPSGDADDEEDVPFDLRSTRV